MAVLNNTRVDVIELLYNIFFQSARDLLDRVKEKGIALIIKVPLDSGWLTGSYSEKTVFSGIKKRWTFEDIQRRSNFVNRLKEIANSSPPHLDTMSLLR